MIIECVSSDSVALPQHYRDHFVAKSDGSRKWPVQATERFIVCGLCVYAGCVLYLIRYSQTGVTDFVPAPLFKVINGSIPNNWKIRLMDQFIQGNLELIIGYPELSDGSDHYDRLVDGDLTAIEVFNKRFSEYEESTEDV